MNADSGWIFTETGLQLYYERHGAGPEMVVLPGASWLAAEYVSRLDAARLLSYDPRGRGRSDPDPDASHLWTDYEVQDLEAVRRHPGLDAFTLIGCSYPGGVAVLYAARYPARVRRLVLVCPVQPRCPAPYDNDDEQERLISQRRDPTLAQRLEKLRSDGLETQDPPAFCRAHVRVEWATVMGKPETLDTMRSDPCACPNEWPGNFARHWQAHFPEHSWHRDWRPQLAAVTMPTLVIHGTADLIPEASSREWAATLSNARLLLLPGVGHMPYLEAPKTFFKAINQFIAGVWPEEALVVPPSIASA